MKIETIYIEETNKEFTLLIGQNAKENDQIIKESEPNDIWFHFVDISSPHIVLQNNGENIPYKYLKQISQLLWLYKSKAPIKQKVMYTTINQIKLTKTPGSVIVKNFTLI